MQAVTLTLGLLQLAFSADECPAEMPNCKTIGLKRQPSKEEQLDFISQEVLELTDMIELSKQKISLLEGLKSTLSSGKNISVPPAYLGELNMKLPRLESNVAPEETQPISSYSDFLTSRSIVQPGEPVNLIQFMALKSSQGAMPSELLVAVGGSDISIFSSVGEELVAPFNAGHQNPIQHLAVSVSQDEHYIATADSASKIRVHKLRVSAVKMTKEEKNPAELFGEACSDKSEGFTEADFTSFVEKELGSEEAADKEKLSKIFRLLDTQGAGKLTEETFIKLMRHLYKVKQQASVTDAMSIKDSKAIRRLEPGEIVECIESAKKDEGSEVVRIKARCIKDGLEGWVTITGNQGTSFLEHLGSEESERDVGQLPPPKEIGMVKPPEGESSEAATSGN